jgi:hypothetical protein
VFSTGRVGWQSFGVCFPHGWPSHRNPLRRRAAVLASALYALVVAISPAFHHDVACHLTSPTRCTACTANVAAPRAEHPPVVPTPGLHLAGEVDDADEHSLWSAPSLRVPARAPPA